MKRSIIETKLNEAMVRLESAKHTKWRLTRDIDYHDQQASSIRKDRQKAINKEDRASAAIVRLSEQLQETS